MPVEHTREIVAHMLSLATDSGRSYDAYVAKPRTGTGPGLLICTEMWGLTPAKCALADDYARRGFCVIVPNVFWRSADSGVIGDQGAERDQAWERLRTFDMDRAVEDLEHAVAWLRAQSDMSGRIAAIGFCMGGRLSVLAALRGTIDAGVALYALGLKADAEALAQTTKIIQLHYGADDIHVPQSEVEAVRAAVDARKNVDIWVYPNAGHGFFNPTRAAYNADAVAAATQRIDAMLATLA